MQRSGFSRFGAYLRSLRKNRDWSLDRVALALGTNRANVHRLEAGRARPRYETVERVARAMEATPDEMTQLFERAGYQAPIWPTTPEDFAAIQRDLQPRWLSEDPPATFITDVYWTLWYANQAFANLFTTREPADLIGRNVLAVLLDPAFGADESLERFATTEDIAEFLQLAVSRLRQRDESGAGDAALKQSIATLRQLPTFERLWHRATRLGEVPGDQLTGSARLQVRGAGDLVMHSATVRRDRRFVYTQILAADELTAGALSPYLCR